MNRRIKNDLVDAGDAIEHILKRLPELPMTEKVDVAALLKAIAKNCAKADTMVKDEIKTRQRGREGTVLGDTFKAILSIVPTRRLDQKAFKEAEPDMYEQYVVEAKDERITFEAR